MAKLLKLRRGTTTQHGSFTGAEGEVTIDTTKDTAVVHDGAQAGGRPLAREDMTNVSSATIAGRLSNDSIATSKIAAGILPSDVKVVTANINDSQINNAKIGASAAIAGTKISPDFGSQVVTTTGNIVVGGTVDGRDVAADGTKLDGIESGATADQTAAEIRTLVGNASDSNVFTDADHTKLDGIEASATADQTSTEIKSLLASDNLTSSHLAASSVGTSELANDAVDVTKMLNFPTGTLLGRSSSGTGNATTLTASEVRSLLNIENGATADQTASEILTLIKTVDGAGSGLDADTFDGISSADFLRSDSADTAAGDITFSGGAGAVSIAANSDIRFANGTWTGETSGKIQHHSNNLYIQYGSGDFIVRNSSSNANTFVVDQSGNATASGNVTAYSDARLKTDISTINDALGICGKLRGVSYKWLKDGSAGIGVIAQEVEQVIPEVVLTNVNTDPATGTEVEVKSVDYGKIVGVLINAINELKEEVEELKNAKITG